MEEQPFEMKAEALNDGIKVSLGVDQWILLRLQGWKWNDRIMFRNENDDVRTMRMILDWTLDWHVKDANGALIPFERETLKSNVESIPLPIQTPRAMIRAVFMAMNEASKLPLL